MMMKQFLLFLLVCCTSSWAAVTVNLHLSTDNSSPNASISSPSFQVVSGNELLLAFVSTDFISGQNTTVKSVTGGGLTWVLVVRTNHEFGTSEIWRAFATTPVSNVVVTATLSQDVVSSMTVLGYAGVDSTGINGSGAIGAIGSGSSGSGAPAASVTTTRSNSWVFGAGNDYDNAILRTPGSNQSVVHQYLASVGDTYWMQMQNSPTPLSGTRVTINDTAPTGDRYNLSAVEVLPSLVVGPTYSVSGSISPSTPGTSIAIALVGTTVATASVDTLGNYSLSNIQNGSYTVTPSLPGYAFSPTSRSVTVNGANVTGISFTSMVVRTWTISGTVSPVAGGAGALLTLSGSANGTTVADSSGNYLFTSLTTGTYTVTPSASGYTFSPLTQTVTIAGANIAGVNFAATSNAGDVIFYDDFRQTSLSSEWTAISRHGEYAQDETECNIPQQVATGSGLVITTAKNNWTCGDFNINGSVRHTPSAWPYITGDVQWTTFKFTYGTVEIRAKFPPQATSLWPATWLLGANCQLTNIYTADTGYYTCPAYGNTGYAEIDMTECYGGGWCQFHVANPGFGIGHGCDATYNVDTNWHVFTTVWTSTSIKQYMDGVLEATCNQGIVGPMFLLIQTQTGGAGGTPNNVYLPAQLMVDYVKVTQP
jgi:hypothetical protein